MKKFILASALVLYCSFTQAQALSESTSISLLTGSSGTELYSTFGHSAIRVQDPAQNLDIVFNYGTFDFSTSNFYLKFTQGKLDYMLSIGRFKDFMMGFKYENRSVTEQVLNLNSEQRNHLYDLLKDNYKPENRYYKYDFFFDNCATRIRDLMISAFGNDLNYQYPDSWRKDKQTFRNLIDMYLTTLHWSDFGIDIALGLPTDDIATPSDYMFLPDYLSEGFGLATLQTNGKSQPLVSSTHLILPQKDIATEVFIITPIRLTSALFIIVGVLSLWSMRNNFNINWLDKIFFTVIGILGWIVFMLWFFTDHIATKDNLNLIWAVPIYFPLFFFWEKLAVRTKKIFIMVFGGIDILILLLWWVWPQSYHVAFIPLILIILMRLICNFISMDKKGISEAVN